MKTTNLAMNHITPKYIIITSLAVAIILFLFHLLIDGFESKYNGYSYYISESLLFSIIWLLIIPIVFIVYKFEWYNLSIKMTLPIILLLSTAHILMYSVFIWVVSLVVFEHTYHISGNLQYGFIKYFVTLIILYNLVILLLKYLKGLNQNSENILKYKIPEQMIVSDSIKKYLIESNEILYIKANTPYLEIHTSDKKYLEQNSLKDMIQKLDHNIFIRVHKSTILNINYVKNFTSRMNGDYDVGMNNGETLRVSRNYAGAFKAKVNPPNQVNI